MPVVPFAIDFTAARRALCATIAAGTGLGPNQILRAQAQGPVQPVPTRPFATFTFRDVGLRAGFRDWVMPAPEISKTATYITGHRGARVDVTFFGESQDDAYGLAITMQGALYCPPVVAPLRQANWAITRVGDVTDVSALLNTGYEGRSLLEFEMWSTSTQLFDPGSIDEVPMVGDIKLSGTLTT